MTSASALVDFVTRWDVGALALLAVQRSCFRHQPWRLPSQPPKSRLAGEATEQGLAVGGELAMRKASRMALERLEGAVDVVAPRGRPGCVDQPTLLGEGVVDR